MSQLHGELEASLAFSKGKSGWEGGKLIERGGNRKGGRKRAQDETEKEEDGKGRRNGGCSVGSTQLGPLSPQLCVCALQGAGAGMWAHLGADFIREK